MFDEALLQRRAYRAKREREKDEAEAAVEDRVREREAFVRAR